MSRRSNPIRAVQLCHETLLWLVPQLDHFPRNRRFTLGERLESHLLGVMADLIEARYSRRKLKSLQQANRQLAVARHLWRLSFELKTINERRYHYGAKLFVALGLQIGGWIKQREGSNQ
jgi:hypothetical protein